MNAAPGPKGGGVSAEQHDFEIRPPKLEEAQVLAEIHVRSWQQTYQGQVPDSYLENLDSDVERRKQVWLHLMTKQQDAGLFVAEVDSKPVGFAMAGPGGESSTEGELFSIYLLSECWEKGIGYALHEHAISHLRHLGFKEAVLWVLDTNDRTRRWYERQGWKPDGTEKKEHREGFTLNELRYRLHL